MKKALPIILIIILLAVFYFLILKKKKPLNKKEHATTAHKEHVNNDTTIIKENKATKVYKVKAGDTFSKIAAAFNISLDKLTKLNPQVKNINLIYVNQKINVPV